jgi:HEPN domain-containing protein
MKENEREALRWYRQAEDDLRFAEWVLHEGRFFDKGCFISQQAGEKALKSCLYAAGSRRVFGHSLVDSCTEVLPQSPAFAKAEEPSKRLDRFYIPTRYPNGLPGGLPFQSYSAKDLQEAIDDLAVIFEICSDFLTRRGIDIS